MLSQVCMSEAQHSCPLAKMKEPTGQASLEKALGGNLFTDSSFERPPTVPGAWSLSPSAKPAISPLSERVSSFQGLMPFDWTHLDNLGFSSHTKVSSLHHACKSCLPCKREYSQTPCTCIRTWAPQVGGGRYCLKVEWRCNDHQTRKEVP